MRSFYNRKDGYKDTVQDYQMMLNLFWDVNLFRLRIISNRGLK